jgi:hypothetical protein
MVVPSGFDCLVSLCDHVCGAELPDDELKEELL